MTKVMNGARAIVHFNDPNKKGETKVGIFNNVSFGLTYDAQPAYILGSYAAAAIDYVSQEVVTITASGWRVIDHGPHADGKMPTVNQLMKYEYLSMFITDRQTNKTIASFYQVRPVSYSTTINAKGMEEITITYVAIMATDETNKDTAESGAQSLP